MALIDCGECGAQVSDKATACPKCGNPSRSDYRATYASAPQASRTSWPRRFFRWIVTGGFAVAIGLFILYAGRPEPNTSAATPAQDTGGRADDPESYRPQRQAPPPNTAGDDQAAAAAASQEPAVQIIDISAPKLYADYAANEVLADSKYKGKWLRVTGTVVEIGKDFTDDPYVTLVGENDYQNVRALFRKTMNVRLADLQKGERVSMLCLGKGRLIGDAVIDCRSDRVPKAQSPTATQAAAPAATDDTPASVPAAPTTYQTSFDCSKARSASERLICEDADLAELDRATAATFQKAKASATDQKEFAQMIRRNWNWRNKNCVDKACLMAWYADEQRQLEEVINGSGQAAAQ